MTLLELTALLEEYAKNWWYIHEAEKGNSMIGSTSKNRAVMQLVVAELQAAMHPLEAPSQPKSTK